jgi:hypothetical protein
MWSARPNLKSMLNYIPDDRAMHLSRVFPFMWILVRELFEEQKSYDLVAYSTDFIYSCLNHLIFIGYSPGKHHFQFTLGNTTLVHLNCRYTTNNRWLVTLLQRSVHKSRKESAPGASLPTHAYSLVYRTGICKRQNL